MIFLEIKKRLKMPIVLHGASGIPPNVIKQCNKYGGNIKKAHGVSDESIRRPTNIFTIFGTLGKIIADKHAYKIYLRSDNPEHGLRKGWNTRHITDFSDNVRFYVRGNEFTRQLDYFIDRIEKRSTENLSSFSEAFKTDMIMQKIIADAHGIRPQLQLDTMPKPEDIDNKSVTPRWKFWQRDA